MEEFSKPISSLAGVGDKTASKLHKIGLETIQDLILYFPRDWQDLSKLTTIKELEKDELVTIKGRVDIINSKRAWKKKMNLTEALVSDDSDSIKIIWFNQPYIAKSLNQGDEVYFSGKVTQDKFGIHLNNPTYKKANKEETTHTARIVPIYSLTKGVTDKQLRFLISEALKFAKDIPEWLPEELIKKFKLRDLPWAYKKIHFPDSFKELDEAKKRLKFDELFIIQLYTQNLKKEVQAQKAPTIIFKEDEIKEFVKSLPFELTAAQKKSAWRILQDLEKNTPMNRLLEGDVGSGKTVVAALAMYDAALNGYQSVLMAPTEILAEQHYKTICELIPAKDVALITGAKKRKIENSRIIIGTHALIQKGIDFDNLGLAIIDEQHRFGVKQRKTLRYKSGNSKTVPHLLSMTATPIPRSLALTIYGDLDLSIINELPKNRKPIISRLVTEDKRPKAYDFIKNKVQEGRQVFVVCPLIEESDKLGVKSVTQEYDKLCNIIFPDLKVGMLHGRLKSAEKEQTMQDFKENKINILVSTSVIEVGIDIPNATIMMIEGADRFGMAQLHQFRGRVGRDVHQSYCLLFTDSDSEKSLARLNMFVSSNDGFELAEYDLQIRGPGDVYGTQQSGYLDMLQLATLADHVLINETKEAVEVILPALEKYPLLEKKLDTFTKQLHLE
ncbi:ATP-dependent DNA helicase RecG [Patescibacteria group bacterium]|nr:ATP-dependent DNA helicase RecG [Patescibacteria group bacterium]